MFPTVIFTLLVFNLNTLSSYTLITHLDSSPFELVTLITAVPLFNPLIFPLLSTLTILLSELLHLTPSVLAFLGLITSVNFFLLLTFKSIFFSLILKSLISSLTALTVILVSTTIPL